MAILRDFFSGYVRARELVGDDDAGRALLDDGVMQASHVFLAVPDVGDREAQIFR